MDTVQEACGQGTDDAAQELGGVVKAHHQILPGRICLYRHHMLQHRQQQ